MKKMTYNNNGFPYVELDYKFKTFGYDDGFRMDIVITENNYEGWIYHKDYGVKKFMFGLPKFQQTYDEALEIFSYNVDEYIESYIEEYGGGMIMYETVEKAIDRINNRVIKELGYGIDDFLYGVAENYEYDMNGNKATCDYIIRGLENEADNFIRVAKEGRD